MVSRETKIQAAFVALAFVLFIAGIALVPEWMALPENAAIWIVAFYGIAFGGSHFYLYFRDEGDAIPRSARGRFLITLGIVLPLLGASTLLEGTSVAGNSAPLLLGFVSAAVFVAFFLNEVRLGYTEFTTDANSR